MAKDINIRSNDAEYAKITKKKSIDMLNEIENVIN